MRIVRISFIIAGILFLTLASWSFVLSGIHWESSEENQQQPVLLLILIGVIILAFGIVFISASFYRFGTGKPRFLYELGFNSICEVIGTISVGEEKIITVLKEQKNSKIRVFEFESVPKAKFVNVIKLESGKRELREFPPKEDSSPSKDS